MPFILIPLVINLLILHSILSLKCAKKMYAYTKGKTGFTFYQGIAFEIVFYFPIENILLAFLTSPTGALALLKSILVAALWGFIFPFTYFIRQKRQEKLN